MKLKTLLLALCVVLLLPVTVDARKNSYKKAEVTVKAIDNLAYRVAEKEKNPKGIKNVKSKKIKEKLTPAPSRYRKAERLTVPNIIRRKR